MSSVVCHGTVRTLRPDQLSKFQRLLPRRLARSHQNFHDGAPVAAATAAVVGSSAQTGPTRASPSLATVATSVATAVSSSSRPVTPPPFSFRPPANVPGALAIPSTGNQILETPSLLALKKSERTFPYNQVALTQQRHAGSTVDCSSNRFQTAIGACRSTCRLRSRQTLRTVQSVITTSEKPNKTMIGTIKEFDISDFLVLLDIS